MTTINVARVINKSRAEKFTQMIEGQSFMNLQVEVCPDGGEFAVNVTTMRPDTTETEVMEMVMGIMFFEMSK